MKNCCQQINISLSGIELRYMLRYPDTWRYFKKYTVTDSGEQSIPEVFVRENEFLSWQLAGNEINGFGEFCLLCMPTSEALFDYNACIFHAAAVRFRERAWLIAAQSGVGKTTQCVKLLENWPDEISVINGDKPALKCEQDGTVMVHPSPWNGKEGLHGADAAELAGMVFLQRGDKNDVSPCSKKEAVLKTYCSIFQSLTSETMIRKTGMLTEKLLKRPKCFRLTSRDIDESNRLLYDVICKETE